MMAKKKERKKNPTFFRFLIKPHQTMRFILLVYLYLLKTLVNATYCHVKLKYEIHYCSNLAILVVYPNPDALTALVVA